MIERILIAGSVNFVRFATCYLLRKICRRSIYYEGFGLEQRLNGDARSEDIYIYRYRSFLVPLGHELVGIPDGETYY